MQGTPLKPRSPKTLGPLQVRARARAVWVKELSPPGGKEEKALASSSALKRCRPLPLKAASAACAKRICCAAACTVQQRLGGF